MFERWLIREGGCRMWRGGSQEAGSQKSRRRIFFASEQNYDDDDDSDAHDDDNDDHVGNHPIFCTYNLIVFNSIKSCNDGDGN